MADFNIPFARDAEKLFPDTTTKENGHPCGPKNRFLDNALQYRLEAECKSLMDYAGIAHTDANMTGVLDAILALINGITGGSPDTSDYVLMTQARSRLPIFPIIDNPDSRIVVIPNGTGSIRVPGGVQFYHRGIYPITTVLTDFATDPSKTYHVRWHKTDGLVLRDLANGTYNPGSLPESNAAFDSGYDDMLIARVTTNSSNVATITNLRNRDKILEQVTADNTVINPHTNSAQATITLPYNLARTPIITPWFRTLTVGPEAGDGGHEFDGNQPHDHDEYWTLTTTRYNSVVLVRRDWAHSIEITGTLMA